MRHRRVDGGARRLRRFSTRKLQNNVVPKNIWMMKRPEGRAPKSLWRAKLTRGCVKMPRKGRVGVQIDAHYALARAMLNEFQTAESKNQTQRRSYE